MTLKKYYSTQGDYLKEHNIFQKTAKKDVDFIIDAMGLNKKINYGSCLRARQARY